MCDTTKEKKEPNLDEAKLEDAVGGVFKREIVERERVVGERVDAILIHGGNDVVLVP